MQQRSRRDEVAPPAAIRLVPPEHGLDLAAGPVAGGSELGNWPSLPDDPEVLASMLDGVEKIGELPGGFGRRDIHKDQMIRSRRSVLGEEVGMTNEVGMTACCSEVADQRRGRDRPVAPVRARRGLAGLALVAVGALAAACGGSPSAGVASLSSSTTTTAAPASPAASSPAASSPAGSPTKGAAQLVAFVRCMRSHGVPSFPMPTVSGDTISLQVGSGTGVDPKSPQFRAAQAACRSLLPNGGEAPTITPADQADYLKGVACMRSHGFPDFPDPQISKNQVHFDIPSSIDQSSDKFKAAVTTCEKLIPAGLPYSGNS